MTVGISRTTLEIRRLLVQAAVSSAAEQAARQEGLIFADFLAGGMLSSAGVVSGVTDP